MIIEEIVKGSDIESIVHKIIKGERISVEEGVSLYKNADISILGYLANLVRERKNGDKVYFNKNLHIEPTNQCIYSCKFCSYYKKKGEEGWEFSREQMLDKVREMEDDITEVHIVGGVHPRWDLHYYGELFQDIKKIRPNIHIKAFTAVEISYIAKRSKMSVKEGLAALKEYGLDSIPGGGAEIFDEEIRQKVCPHKDTGEEWLYLHKTAHELGIPTNATILYGHIESIEHRIDHFNRLRELQDQTGGFNVFIPLKYKKENNELGYLGEVSVVEDIKLYAMARIFLDNFGHIKAYWPMIGKDISQLLLSFGVDDFDGTINDSTQIYSLAGAEDQSPSMSTKDMVQMIEEVGRKAVERDSIYNIIEEF
ncbi:MAG: aminofutalosine synthase MqnE [Bacteroidetes bacterium 4572_112]|nr:MAG: aminofutalosine synthase MqnE [Bacteroidetes bacterium 4572_112]